MALPPPPSPMAPPTPPPGGPPAEAPAPDAPATPDGPVITLPAELIPDGLPDSGKMVITYTSVPDSADGEMRAFVVTAVEPEDSDSGSPDVPSVDDAFESAFPKKPAKAPKPDTAE